MTTILPWIKSRTNLHLDPVVWGLSDQAQLLLFRTLHLPSAEKLSVDYVIWNGRVDRAVLDEVVTAGVMAITDDGRVELADFVKAPHSESRDRVRRCRAAKKQMQDTTLPGMLVEVVPRPRDEGSYCQIDQVAATPPTTIPVVDQKPPVDDTQNDLIIPDVLSPLEKKQIIPLLVELPKDRAQMVLDELAGAIMFGTRQIDNRAGWTTAVVRQIKNGGFTPNHAITVSERRKMMTAPRGAVQIPIPDQKPLPPINPEDITDPALRERVISINKMLASRLVA